MFFCRFLTGIVPLGRHRAIIGTPFLPEDAMNYGLSVRPLGNLFLGLAGWFSLNFA